MDRLEERIREQAYHIWKEEGCPEAVSYTHLTLPTIYSV